jgi:hypothetical protein
MVHCWQRCVRTSGGWYCCHTYWHQLRLVSGDWNGTRRGGMTRRSMLRCRNWRPAADTSRAADDAGNGRCRAASRWCKVASQMFTRRAAEYAGRGANGWMTPAAFARELERRSFTKKLAELRVVHPRMRRTRSRLIKGQSCADDLNRTSIACMRLLAAKQHALSCCECFVRRLLECKLCQKKKRVRIRLR